MKKYKVKKGECFSSLAKEHGFHEADQLHSHGTNSALKAKRPNPNVLAAGDKASIPDRERKVVSGATDKKHRFEAKGIRTDLRFLIEEFDGTAFANKSYSLEVENDTFEGTTGGDGLIEHMILSSATKGLLTVWLDDKKDSCIKWPLEIGELNPHDSTRGMQARLNNLGFSCGPVDGIAGARTKAAVKAFRKKHNLGDSDAIDDATQTKLQQLYGY